MTERERLINLINEGLNIASKEIQIEIKEFLKNHSSYNSKTDRTVSIQKRLADYLLENGVIVPPAKVGTMVFEAIKEFAERVKMAFYYEFDEIIPSIMADKINEIVKEMTEGENGKERYVLYLR